MDLNHTQKKIEYNLFEDYKLERSTYEEKCQIGENDSYICSLIRQDSIEEFISYVNRSNISLSAKIQPSILETNPFLINKKPTLIKYAAFFGSIRIFQYLRNNNVPLKKSLWLYAIHSNSAELIQFLEENKIEPEINLIFSESIKCHHNNIARYIQENLLDLNVDSETKENLFDPYMANYQKYFYNNFGKIIIDSLNYFFCPDDVASIICMNNSIEGFLLSRLCSSLTQITIPPSVTSIGDYVFKGCSSLTQITIPSSVTSIGNYVFEGCSSLTQITIPSSVTSIGRNIFDVIKMLEITGDIKCIPERLFLECSSLTQITIPSSVTSIEFDTFSSCSSLAQITIPCSVISIGSFAFTACSSLTQITFDIPSSVTSIGENAFYDCTSLVHITIPSSVTSIEESAFRECSSLPHITIPCSITSIKRYTFNKCSSLTQITIPSSVTSIRESAFDECTSLVQISIPSSVTSIENFAFIRCKRLKKIIIHSLMTKLQLYDLNFKALYFDASGTLNEWLPFKSYNCNFIFIRINQYIY